MSVAKLFLSVAELGIHQRVASAPRPVMELRGFARVGLKPGEKKTLEFKLTPHGLHMLDRDLHWMVEPDVFAIMVGSSSDHTDSVPLEVAP